MRINLLVTGAGAPGTPGTLFALREGAKAEGVILKTIGVDQNHIPGMKAIFDDFHTVPRADDPDYVTELEKIVRGNSISLVIPQTTAETRVLSKSRAQFSAPILSGDPKAISIAEDKLQLSHVFAERKLGAPAFYSVTNIRELNEAASALGFPSADFVIKARNSSGGRGVRIVTKSKQTMESFLNEKPTGMTISLETLTEILESKRDFPSLLVTEKLNAPEVSVDVYLGKFGEFAVPRVRHKIRTGISVETELIQNDELVKKSIEAGRAIGLTGVFGFQYMKGDSEYKVIECNPRIQGTMVASLLSGRNLIWLAVREKLEFDSLPRFEKMQSSGVFRRLWGGTMVLDGKSVFL